MPIPTPTQIPIHMPTIPTPIPILHQDITKTNTNTYLACSQGSNHTNAYCAARRKRTRVQQYFENTQLLLFTAELIHSCRFRCWGAVLRLLMCVRVLRRCRNGCKGNLCMRKTNRTQRKRVSMCNGRHRIHQCPHNNQALGPTSRVRCRAGLKSHRKTLPYTWIGISCIIIQRFQRGVLEPSADLGIMTYTPKIRNPEKVQFTKHSRCCTSS